MAITISEGYSFGSTELVTAAKLTTFIESATISFTAMKTGTDQSDASAAAGELYADTNDDNTIKLGA